MTMKTPDLHIPVDLDNVPELALSQEQLDAIARTARTIAQRQTRRQRGILTERDARPYDECTRQERAGMRAGVLRVLQTLVILGYIERP